MMDTAAWAPIAAAAREAANNIQQDMIVNEAIHEVKAINASHPKADVRMRAGFVAELWHKATYNIDAIERGVRHRWANVYVTCYAMLTSSVPWCRACFSPEV